MDIVEFESNIVEGKYIRVPADIVDKIGDYSRIGVILKVSRDTIQNDRTNEEARIQTAFDEYRAKYPDDEVSLNDFKYVGILSERELEGYGEYSEKISHPDEIEKKKHFIGQADAHGHGKKIRT